MHYTIYHSINVSPQVQAALIIGQMSSRLSDIIATNTVEEFYKTFLSKLDFSGKVSWQILQTFARFINRKHYSKENFFPRIKRGTDSSVTISWVIFYPRPSDYLGLKFIYIYPGNKCIYPGVTESKQQISGVEGEGGGRGGRQMV